MEREDYLVERIRKGLEQKITEDVESLIEDRVNDFRKELEDRVNDLINYKVIFENRKEEK